MNQGKKMSLYRIRVYILFILVSSMGIGSPAYGDTVDKATDCVLALISSSNKARNVGLDDVATLEFRRWLNKKIEDVPLQRRAKIINAIMYTEINDAKIPEGASALYSTMDERVYLRSREVGGIVTFVRLIHELDHLFFDLNHSISSPLLKLWMRILDPRSTVWRVEQSSHQAEYDYMSKLLAAESDPLAVYKRVMHEHGLSEEVKEILLEVVQRNRGRRDLVVDEDLLLRIRNKPELLRQFLNGVFEVLSKDLAKFMDVEDQNRKAYIRRGVWEYRRAILNELAFKLGLYSLVAGVYFALIH